MNGYLPDLSKLPDSEAKREVENLASEFENLLEKMNEEIQKKTEFSGTFAEVSKIWYRMNAKVGRLFEQERDRKDKNRKFYFSIIISLAALTVSIIALLK